MKMLTRRGVLVKDKGQTYLAEPDTDGEESLTLRPLQAAAITYCSAFGPRAGQVELKLKTPWRDETTHLVMSLLEFMQRLLSARSRALRPGRTRIGWARLLKRVFDINTASADCNAEVLPGGAARRVEAALPKEREP